MLGRHFLGNKQLQVITKQDLIAIISSSTIFSMILPLFSTSFLAAKGVGKSCSGTISGDSDTSGGSAEQPPTNQEGPLSEDNVDLGPVRSAASTIPTH